MIIPMIIYIILFLIFYKIFGDKEEGGILYSSILTSLLFGTIINIVAVGIPATLTLSNKNVPTFNDPTFQEILAACDIYFFNHLVPILFISGVILSIAYKIIKLSKD